jgi:colicin import membrane protein
MSAAVYRDEPGKVASGVMAVAVHVVFFVLLVFGMSWQRRAPEAVVVDLWNNLPPAPVTKVVEPEPQPKPEIKPPPPVEVKPVPKVEPKPVPEKPIVKPDIALEKEKQEKAKREREEREKAETKKREDLAKAEARKKEEKEKQRIAALEADRVAKEIERRLEKEQKDALARLQQQEAAAAASARAKYIGEIRAKIRRFIVVPPDIKGNPQVEFDVVLLPTGDVLGVKLRKGSEHAAYDNAVERAIMRAQPLPVPPDPALFKDFRELNLQFRPNE